MNASLPRRCAEEAIGTALLVGIGTGAIVAGASSGGTPSWVLAVAWFAAVATPIQAFARTSGAHLNPVVSLALLQVRRFPRSEIVPYVGAQIAGALAGSLGVALSLGRGAHLGATEPAAGYLLAVVPLEFAFTFALVASVLFLAGRTTEPSRALLLLPAVVVGISTYVIGPITGSSLNPARTLAPALLSGSYDAIGLYLVTTPLAALAAAALFPRRILPNEPA